MSENTETPEQFSEPGDMDPALLERLEAIDDAEGERRASALRQGLEDYELEDDDVEVIDGYLEGTSDYVEGTALPVLAVVGRPNVG